MTELNDNHDLPPIQILITACAAYGEPDPRCAWLHGYCLLTLRPGSGTVQVNGEVRTGERHGDDRPIIEALTAALDPDAVLAGLDLTDTLGRLGRLPTDAADQRPALALLAKLKTMLADCPPLDLTLTDTSQTAVALQVLQHELCFRERFDGDGHDAGIGIQLFGNQDNRNPNQLVVELADTAGAVLLAVGDLYLDASLHALLLAAWEQWRSETHAEMPAAWAEAMSMID